MIRDYDNPSVRLPESVANGPNLNPTDEDAIETVSVVGETVSLARSSSRCRCADGYCTGFPGAGTWKYSCICFFFLLLIGSFFCNFVIVCDVFVFVYDRLFGCFRCIIIRDLYFDNVQSYGRCDY